MLRAEEMERESETEKPCLLHRGEGRSVDIRLEPERSADKFPSPGNRPCPCFAKQGTTCTAVRGGGNGGGATACVSHGEASSLFFVVQMRTLALAHFLM